MAKQPAETRNSFQHKPIQERWGHLFCWASAVGAPFQPDVLELS